MRSETLDGSRAVLVDEAVNRRDEFVVIEWLPKDGVGHKAAVLVRTRDDDPRDGPQRGVSPDVIEQVGAADTRQHQVDQDHVWTEAVLQQIQRLLAVVRRYDRKTFLLEDGKQERDEVRIVLHDEDARLIRWLATLACHKDVTLHEH